MFAQEVIATFFLVAAFMTVAMPDTTYTDMEIQIWIAIPLLVTTLSEMVSLPMGMNPALGFAYQLSYSIKLDVLSTLIALWAIVLGPFIGSIVGSVFYEHVFKRIFAAYQVEEDSEQVQLRERLNGSREA